MQPQELLQRLRAALHEREIVEGQLGDQPPELRSSEQRLDRARGLHERDDALERRAAREREVAALVAEREAAREVAVEARESARYRLRGGAPHAVAPSIAVGAAT